ncbi:DUF4198 domain-containing protein [Spongorhabdus nitratireducens]
MKKGFKSVFKAAVVTAGLLSGAVVSTVQAHPLWVLPGEFNVSDEKASWVTFDVSASHTVFGYDKSPGLEQAKVFSPDGDSNSIRTYFKSQRRSVFDWQLTQDGTYKVHVQRPTFYYTRYKAGKREQDKWVSGNKIETKAKLPDNARDIETMLYDISSVAYVTRNAPTDSVFQPTNKGFELVPQIHPNDIIQDEKVTLNVLIDGKPAKGAKVEITPGGSQYRNDRNSIELETDESGRIQFTPGQAGPWLMSASLVSPLDSPMADTVKAVRFLTFEVIPN